MKNIRSKAKKISIAVVTELIKCTNKAHLVKIVLNFFSL